MGYFNIFTGWLDFEWNYSIKLDFLKRTSEKIKKILANHYIIHTLYPNSKNKQLPRYFNPAMNDQKFLNRNAIIMPE